MMRKNQEMQIFLVGIMANLSLALVKLSVFFIGYTKLLLMDGLYSLLCAQMFFFSWGGYELDKKKSNDKYPYGLGKALYLVLGVGGCITLIISIYMFIFGIEAMGWVEAHKSNTATMMICLISIISNELIYRYLHDESIRTDNHIIPINIVINRLGVVISTIVFICVAFAGQGYDFLERTGVIIISIVLFILSLRILFMCFGVIMDRVPSDRTINQVRQYAGEVNGVSDVLEVRARKVGTWTYLELAVAVDDGLAVMEANSIVAQVEEVLLKKIKRVKEVNVGFI